MTSLAVLAHAAPAPAPFNADFYTVAATVIPVLFLAINVQPAFRFIQYTGSLTGRQQPKRTGSRQPALITWLAGGFYMCLIYGVTAEALAIIALANRTAPHFTQTLIAAIILFLTAAAARGPWLQLFPAVAEAQRTTRNPDPAGPGKTGSEG